MFGVIERDDVNRPSGACAETPLKFDDLFQIAGRVLDEQIHVGLGKILAGCDRAEEDSEANAGLGAKRFPQAMQKLPVPPQVGLLVIGKP